MTDMFKDVKLSDWGIGDYALHGNRKVRIVDVNLLEKKRQVAWQEYGEKGETRQWVSVEDLREIKAAGTPIPPKVEPSLAAAAAALAAEDEAMNAMPNVPAGYEVVRYIPPSPGEGGEIWLKPPPGSGVVTDIAQREIDLAKERDELLAKVERLEREKNALVEDYDGKLKFQLERANELVDERDKIKRESALRIAQLRTALGAMPDNDDMDYLEHLLMHTMAELRGQIGDLKAQAQPQPTTRRKNETKIITLHVGLASTNMELGRYIDELDAEGWEIAYEEYQQGVGEHGSTYFARLIRPAQDPISPPQDEARAAVTVDDINALDSDPAPEVADNSVAMLWRSEDEWPDPDNGDEVDLDEVDEEEPELVPEMLIVGLDDEPDWKKEKDPATRERMIYDARKATLGPKRAGAFIAQQRGRERRKRTHQIEDVVNGVVYRVGEDLSSGRQIPIGVTVGRTFLDAKKFPLACTIVTQGLQATTEALDNQIRVKALAAMQAAQTRRPMAVPLLLGS